MKEKIKKYTKGDKKRGEFTCYISFLEDRYFLMSIGGDKSKFKEYGSLEELIKKNKIRADDNLSLLVEYRGDLAVLGKYARLQKILEEDLSANHLIKNEKRRLRERIKILKKIRALKARSLAQTGEKAKRKN